MTDAQMLQNLLVVYETMVRVNDFLGGRWNILDTAILTMKEVIAELRRRIELKGTK